MKKLYILFFSVLISALSFGQDLVITGIMDGPLPGGLPKALELYVVNDIPDLSIYGLESTTNGAAAAGQEYTFPADSKTAGEYIYIGTEQPLFNQYLGFNPTYIDGVMNVNGDDTIILYLNAAIYDLLGEIGVDGTGTAWESLDGWAYRVNGFGPNTTFTASEWIFSGANATDGCDLADDTGTNAGCASVFPVNTYSPIVSTDPTLTIPDGPANGSVLTMGPHEAGTPTILFETTNFTVGVPNAGDGYIVWNTKDDVGTILESGQVQDITVPITPTFVPGNTYSLNAELVNNSGDPLNPAVTYTTTVTFKAYVQVADLAGLRAGTIGEYYEVTGEIIGTHAQSYRNQKWAEDTTAGILIDDDNAVITTVYNEGDGVTGLKGQLGLYSGLIQIVPVEDPGPATSTGNPVVPQPVTIADLLANHEPYESELVQITDVTFASGDGVATFATYNNYDISDASGGPITFSTYMMRFPDYDGEIIPSTPKTINVLVGDFNGVQVASRNMTTDLVLGIKNLTPLNFKVYPNPTSLGYVNLSSKNNANMSVTVFDILGKQVLNETISNNRLDVSGLTSGMYIMKVSQDNASITKKLVIQ